MQSLRCNTYGHVVKDNGPFYFGMTEHDCWCGGKLTNPRTLDKLAPIILTGLDLLHEVLRNELRPKPILNEVGSIKLVDNTSEPIPSWIGGRLP